MRLKYFCLIIIILFLYSCKITSKEEIIDQKYSLEEVKVINNDFLLILDTLIEKSQKCIFVQENNPYFFQIGFSFKDTLNFSIQSVQYASTLSSIYLSKRFSKYCFYYRGILFVAENISENIFKTCGREIYIYPITHKKAYKDYTIINYYSDIDDYSSDSMGIYVTYNFIDNRFVLLKEDLCDENIRERKIKETKEKIIYQK
ncbi:MAG: hypothetical protein H6Q16_2124 [Bacteroidetes bacterium]|nr:hypothetical protein [Bacteroidota bacterium]